MRNFISFLFVSAALHPQSSTFQSYVGKQVYTKALIGTLNEQLKSGLHASEVAKTLNTPDVVPLFKVSEVEGSICKLTVIADGQETPYSAMPCDELVPKDSLKLGEKVQADVTFRGSRNGITVDFNLKNLNCDTAANVCNIEVSVTQTVSASLETTGDSDSLSVTVFSDEGKVANTLTFIRPSGRLVIPKKIPISMFLVAVDAMSIQTTFGFVKGSIETSESPKKAAKALQKLYKGKLQLSAKDRYVDLTLEPILKKVPAYVY